MASEVVVVAEIVVLVVIVVARSQVLKYKNVVAVVLERHLEIKK